MDKISRIGFPPDLLIPAPLRVDVLDFKKGLYAVVNKPADILFDSYLGAPKKKSMMQAIRAQKGKPELERLGVDLAYSVNQSDYEVSGAAMFVMNKDLATVLRNAAWSEMFELEYVFLARKSDAPDKFHVDLPMLMHEERPVWIVSHRFGKKANTSFERILSFRDYEIWRAKTKSARPHQVRLHAAESGLKILGENIYSRAGNVYLSSLKGEYVLPRGADCETPLYPHLALHASAIKMRENPELAQVGSIDARAPLPQKFCVMLKRIGFENLENI